MYKLGVIGAGHMGMTMLDSAVQTGALRSEDVLVYDIAPPRAEAARSRGFALAVSERVVYESCRYLLLAVLPQHCEDVLHTLAAEPSRKLVVISIVSGFGSAFIRGILGADTAVVNVVPNLGLSVGLGATAVSRTEGVADDVFDGILRIFEKLGQVAVVEEALLKEIIPVNGCAPGYVFYMIDAMARAAAERGIDYPLAVRMAAASFAGAARMLLDSDASPRELMNQVCSPGGLTAQGIAFFNQNGLDLLLAGGMAESAKRGYELAR